MPSTIYMETFGLKLRKSGGALKISKDGKKVNEFPAIGIDSVMISSEGVSISGGAVNLCRENNIPIFFLPLNGGEISVLAPVESLCPELQAAQILLRYNPEGIFNISRCIVKGKVKNQLSLIKYFKNSRKIHDPGFLKMIKEYEAAVKSILSDMEKDSPIDDIGLMRGRFFSAEGRAAGHYWKAVSMLMPESTGFKGRVGKGAGDPVNSLLNYGYAILSNKVRMAILKAGLSSYFSFLHAPQQGRASLVYDMIEEFRAWGVDRVVFGIIGKGRIPVLDNSGRLTQEDRRFLISSLEKRWEKDAIMKKIDKQVKCLRKTVENGEEYVPVLFKSNGLV